MLSWRGLILGDGNFWGSGLQPQKVIVSPTDLEVRLRPNGIERLVLELRPEPAKEAAEVTT